jgi:CRISPR-associated protein Cas7/Cst2/DevR subtype I-B
MSSLAGKLVIEIREGAPNNGDADDNGTTRVKRMRIGREVFPYVAPQAYRRWLRDTLTDGTDASPVVRVGKGKRQQAYTAGEPHKFVDDDLMGYMRAVEGDRTYRDTVVYIGTLRAISPTRVVEDFGTMSRGFTADEHPVIHRHEFYTASIATDLLIDVAHIGVFTLGGAGHRRNLNQQQRDDALAAGATPCIFRGVDALALPLDERRERLARLLEAMSSVHGGAKKALHYGDRTPALLLLAPMRGQLNPFGRIIGDRDGHTTLQETVLQQELAAWQDEITGPLRLGWAPGYLEAERTRVASALDALQQAGRLIVDHPRILLKTLAAEIRDGSHDTWFDDEHADLHPAGAT